MPLIEMEAPEDACQRQPKALRPCKTFGSLDLQPDRGPKQTGFRAGNGRHPRTEIEFAEGLRRSIQYRALEPFQF
jgi:hypothetical protein